MLYIIRLFCTVFSMADPSQFQVDPDSYSNWCLNPFSTKRYYSTEFFRFFAELWVHATLLIIVRFCSNLRCWIVHYLSFLEKKTELIYLHYRPFYNCLGFIFDFLAKKCPKRCVHCLKTENYFQLISWTENDIEKGF